MTVAISDGDRAARRAKLVRVALWVLACVLGARMLGIAMRDAYASSHGFVSHYTAARLLLDGAPVERFYDDAWFRAEVARVDPAGNDLHGANLPTMGLTLLPLAPLPYRMARITWVLGSFAGAVVVVAWLGRMARLSGIAWPALFALTFAFQPLRENLYRGQVYVLALALSALALFGLRSGRVGLTGASLGWLLMTKSVGPLLWPYLVARRHWRALAWGGGSAALVALLSLPRVGADAWAAYLDSARELPSVPYLSRTAYQSLAGFTRHLFVHHPTANPVPLLDWATAGWLAGPLLVLAALATSLVVAARRQHAELTFGAFVLLGLVASPVTVDYHYTMALLPIALLLGAVHTTGWSGATQLVVLGALLLAADLPYQSPRVTNGVWALLAYPKLYGALVLWALSLRLALGTGGAPNGASLPAAEARP